MRRFTVYFLVAGAALLHAGSACLAAPAQVPLQQDGAGNNNSSGTAPAVSARRKLHGRFLQITDMHPDPFYRVGVSHKHACHRANRKPKKNEKPTGVYGTPFDECDSPLKLTNFTLDFLSKEWASEIDFVVWTGDNARHDNDRKHPRTPAEIYMLNRAVAAKMRDVFSSRGIPVVPSLGNNDVWPHNILAPGPNSITNEYSSIWKDFVPFPSYGVFQRGAYYSVEVIPDAVAVIALNTMYFYDSNKAVGGCEWGEKDAFDPGNLQFDWLEVQLNHFRDRGMKVYLSGHVPPSPGNYFPECYVRYVELALRFQDTILGHLYGHMNTDHFFLLEAQDLDLPAEETGALGERTGAAPSAPDRQRRRQPVRQEGGGTSLYASLLNDFAALPEKKKLDYGDYAVVNVGPALVPNPYTPSFRIFSYNITGGTEAETEVKASGGDDGEDVEATKDRKHGHHRGGKGDKVAGCKKSPWKDTWRCHLSQAWHTDKKAPSRVNTLWTPLGYAQYFIEDLYSANKSHKPKFTLEYTTFPPSALHPAETADAPSAEGKGDGGDDYVPIPPRHLPRSLRNSTAGRTRRAPYAMEDLTVPSWVKLARAMSEKEKKKGKRLRKAFKQFMYFGSEEE